MAGYKLSDEADASLDEFFEYSALNFGLQKAQEYFSDFPTASWL